MHLPASFHIFSHLVASSQHPAYSYCPNIVYCRQKVKVGCVMRVGIFKWLLFQSFSIFLQIVFWKILSKVVPLITVTGISSHVVKRSSFFITKFLKKKEKFLITFSAPGSNCRWLNILLVLSFILSKKKLKKIIG